MNILLIDNGTRHADELRALLAPHRVMIVRYRRSTRLDREWADLIILSGGGTSPLHRALYRHEIDLIRTTQAPVIGICLGFELIAAAYGEKLRRHRSKFDSLYDVTLAPELLGSEYRTTFRVREAHYWVLEQTRVLETLGRSSRGIEAIRHPTRRVFGLQFHPEVVRPRNDGAVIMNKLIRYVMQTESDGATSGSARRPAADGIRTPAHGPAPAAG